MAQSVIRADYYHFERATEFKQLVKGAILLAS